jgi:hypothetical protein
MMAGVIGVHLIGAPHCGGAGGSRPTSNYACDQSNSVSKRQLKLPFQHLNPKHGFFSFFTPDSNGRVGG